MSFKDILKKPNPWIPAIFGGIIAFIIIKVVGNYILPLIKFEPFKDILVKYTPWILESYKDVF